MNYRKINNIVGWVAFAIAAFVYLATMERTVSFWDCGEFLSTAYKQEVGHSPGAPFFALIQRMFGLFAENGLTAGPSRNAALLMNAESALTSAATILFLFWTITYFAKKMLARDVDMPSRNQTLLIMGSGLVGALAYTFSDTFWFSAVEGEVYATSSFFTALTFWAILKWERIADEPGADRWLLFIAYLIGLSVAIHLLNLLSIPPIGLVFYFRRYKATTTGAIVAFILSCVVLGAVQFGVLQGLPAIAGWCEITFVNGFGLPFDSGALTFLVLLVVALVWLVSWTKKRGSYYGHLATLSVIFILIGFSSYLIPVVRSRADVPIDMTNPDNTFTLLSYLQREQFGQQPILYGPDFTAQSSLDPNDDDGNQYLPEQKEGKDHYAIVGQKPKIIYQGSQRFFPRMWDNNDASHMRFYRDYVGLSEGEDPSGRDNMTYFIGYQMNWMWWRYFMWNYAGRQNDFEGQGEAKNGNWISGIPFLDKARGLGDMSKMADGYVNNRARNQLYFLPLILGIMGLVYQFNRDRRDGWVVFTLFFFTGIAIGIYLNMTPLQPRERDYAFAGSTYAFAIWIGLGVLMLHDLLQKAVKGAAASYGAIGISMLAVPVLMASQEWDDHDRSGKTLARATAINTLQSCEKNAVLFTFGDNETYPLWYAQEIEGIRPDVRVINTSLLGIGWYIDQLNYKVNEADAVPMAWKPKDYKGDSHNYLLYSDDPSVPKDRFFPLAEIVKFYTSDSAKYKLPDNRGKLMNYLPTQNMEIPGASVATLQGMGIKASDSAAAQPIRFTLQKTLLQKDELAQLAIISQVAAEGWKRPIYFSSLQETGTYGQLQDYMKLEGTVYRLTPYRGKGANSPTREGGYVDLDKSVRLFKTLYTYGGAGGNNVYFDEKNRLMFMGYRINASHVAEELALAGRKQEAVEVLDKVMSGISERSMAYDGPALYVGRSYFIAGAPQKGKAIFDKLVRNSERDMEWIYSLAEDNKFLEFLRTIKLRWLFPSPEEALASTTRDVQQNLGIVNTIAQVAQQSGDTAYARQVAQKFEVMLKKAQPMMGGMRQ